MIPNGRIHDKVAKQLLDNTGNECPLCFQPVSYREVRDNYGYCDDCSLDETSYRIAFTRAWKRKERE